MCHQWLQSERKPANFSEVVEELFQVIPDEVLYLDSSPERCRTCAVVGNSGNLKGARYGALIDDSDFIIRLGSFCYYCLHRHNMVERFPLSPLLLTKITFSAYLKLQLKTPSLTLQHPPPGIGTFFTKSKTEPILKIHITSNQTFPLLLAQTVLKTFNKSFLQIRNCSFSMTTPSQK